MCCCEYFKAERVERLCAEKGGLQSSSAWAASKQRGVVGQARMESTKCRKWASTALGYLLSSDIMHSIHRPPQPPAKKGKPEPALPSLFSTRAVLKKCSLSLPAPPPRSLSLSLALSISLPLSMSLSMFLSLTLSLSPALSPSSLFVCFVFSFGTNMCISRACLLKHELYILRCLITEELCSSCSLSTKSPQGLDQNSPLQTEREACETAFLLLQYIQ